MNDHAICFKIGFLAICLFSALSWGKVLYAESQSISTPPVIHTVVCGTPPVIDGNLDDPCWDEAYKCEDFWRTDKDKPEPSPERTRVYICYDKEALYVAFYCFDREPDKIRAMQKKRGGMIWQDDVAELGLDTYHTHKECYWFDITAGGTQYDQIPGGSGTKVEWRGDWEGASEIAEDGWVAEMAIPWKVLRFPKNTTVMGIYAARGIPHRDDIWVMWPNLGTNWDSNKMADLVNLELPEIKHPPVVLPHILGIAHQDHRREISAGLNVKQPFGSGLTASLTVNPDFETIEDEVESIDFSYTERYISDRRPFFTEGTGFFPGSSMFYTRRIEDIDAGIKIFGRTGKARVGVLDVADIGHRNDFSGKFQYDPTPNSGIWAGGVHTSKIDSSNGNLGFGGYYEYKKEKGGYYSGFALLKTVVGNKKGNIFSADAGGWSGGARGSYVEISFRDVGEGYTSWAAFIPEENYWRVGLNTGLWRRYDESFIKQYSTWVNVEKAHSHADTLMYQGVSFGGYIGIRKLNTSGGHIGLSYYERPPSIDRTVDLGLGWNEDDIHQKGSVGMSVGKKASADYLYMNLNQGYKPTENLSFKLRGEFRRMKEPSEDAEYKELVMLTGNYDLTSEHSIGLRILHRYDFGDGEDARVWSIFGNGNLNVCLTYRQAVRAGTDIFLILGDPNEDRTQKRFAMKIIRPLF